MTNKMMQFANFCSGALVCQRCGYGNYSYQYALAHWRTGAMADWHINSPSDFGEVGLLKLSFPAAGRELL